MPLHGQAWRVKGPQHYRGILTIASLNPFPLFFSLAPASIPPKSPTTPLEPCCRRVLHMQSATCQSWPSSAMACA